MGILGQWLAKGQILTQEERMKQYYEAGMQWLSEHKPEQLEQWAEREQRSQEVLAKSRAVRLESQRLIDACKRPGWEQL